MEYQRKKKQILKNIEYNNLLGFSFVQNKLQRNFKSIVQALILTQTQANQVKEDLISHTDSNTRQFQSLNDKINNLQKKIQELQNKQVTSTSNQAKQKKENQQYKINQQDVIPSSQQFQININTVKSQDNIPSVCQSINQQNAKDNNQYQKLLHDNYQQLRDKINNLLQNQINPNELDRKINQMKDSINLLKAQLKAINDRQSKSIKRSSLQNNQLQLIPTTNTEDQQKNFDNHKYFQQLKSMQQQLQKQINNLHIEINTLKLSVEQLKDSSNQNRRKDNKINLMVQQLSRNQKKLQEKLKSSNQTFETQIKQIKNQLLSLQTKPQTDPQLIALKKSRKNIEGKDSFISKQNMSPNANQQINDRISKLQAAIQGLVTQAQFKRFKTDTQDKFDILDQDYESLKKQFKDEIQILTEILDNKQIQIAQIIKDIEAFKDQFSAISCECQRKNHFAGLKHSELANCVQNLRADLQFYKSMNEGSIMQPKLDIQPSKNSNDDQQSSKQKSQIPAKSSQDIKKYLNRKLHDQRTYLLGLIRDLEKKSGNKNNLQQDFSSVWDKLAEINLFLQKKANDEDVRKNLSYLQKKLATLYQRITTSDQNNQDARIAKTNWFCLSCDKNLHNYQGKVGQHIVWDTMPIKAGYTKYYGKEDKKALPLLKR